MSDWPPSFHLKVYGNELVLVVERDLRLRAIRFTQKGVENRSDLDPPLLLAEGEYRIELMYETSR